MISNIKDEFETIQTIIDGRASIARYGDGELKYCLGHHQQYQEHVQKLEALLKHILYRDIRPSLLIGIPRVSTPDFAQNKDYWNKHTSKKHVELLNPNIQYYSAFISRPDAIPRIDTLEYKHLCMKIWENKDVLVVQGEGRVFDGDGSFLRNARSVNTIYGPRKNAYAHYHEILYSILEHPQDTIVILSLGLVATLLASSLDILGYQALDLGQLGPFFSGILDAEFKRLPRREKNAYLERIQEA